MTARVQITNLSDLFIRDFKAQFSTGMLVKGCILNVDAKLQRVEMSLRDVRVLFSSFGKTIFLPAFTRLPATKRPFFLSPSLNVLLLHSNEKKK